MSASVYMSYAPRITLMPHCSQHRNGITGTGQCRMGISCRSILHIGWCSVSSVPAEKSKCGISLKLELSKKSRSGSHKTKCGRTLPTGPLFNLLVALGGIRIGPSGLRLKYSGHYTVPNVITAVENIIWNILLFMLGFRGPQGSGYHLAALSKMVEPSEEFGHLSDVASYRGIESIIHPRLDSKHTKEAKWAQPLLLHEPFYPSSRYFLTTVLGHC